MTIASYLLILPNWNQPVQVTKRWLTVINKSITGKEKRSRLYNRSRFFTRYKLTMAEYETFAQLRSFLFTYLGQVIGIPLWPFVMDLTAQANSGQPDLSVESTASKHLYEGMRVAIFEASDVYTWEAGTIDSVTSTVITLQANLTSTWATGSLVVPIIPCMIGEAQGLNLLTDMQGDITLDAEEWIAESIQ